MNRFRRLLLPWSSLTTTLIAAALILSCPAARAAEPVMDVYVSTGDNHFLGSSLPVDSPASIEATFDLFKNVNHARRIYWRGLEEACWVSTMHARPENPRYFSLWTWMQWLYANVKPDQVAVKAARARGMEIWGMGTLWDWGSPADTPTFNDYPFPFESKLRLDHPEWVPVDKHGARRQGGPIELAHPDARRALVKLTVDETLKAGYDGICFLTYVENYSLRFQDEFGYSDPIVEDFKKQYKLDLRTEPFRRGASREDWLRLRGSYVTAFLRELKAELDKHKIKLGMVLNSNDPRQPQSWNVPELVLTAGSQLMDVDTWVREGLVDELIVYGNNSGASQLKTLQDMRFLARNTRTEVSVMTSGPFREMWQPFQAKGMPTLLAVSDDAQHLERGFVPEQTAGAMNGPDVNLRMRALQQCIAGTLKLDEASVAAAAGSPNLIERRLALQALGKSNTADLKLLLAGLDDGENGVRCAAALALADRKDPAACKSLLRAAEQHGNHMLRECVVIALRQLTPTPAEELGEAALHSPSEEVREVAMRALQVHAKPGLVPVFKEGLRDKARFPRFAAAEALGNVTRTPSVIETLIAATERADVVVANRAATSLAALAVRRQKENEPLRPRVIEALKNLFAKFGDGCTRADADWGYRPVGNALLRLKPEGEAVLQAFMDQRKDKRLAELAWKTLHIRQDKGTFSEVTEKENEEAFKKRPVFGRDLRVDPAQGDDASATGPFKTIARAIKLAAPGDTIHLAQAHYRECAVFANKSGEPGRPITLDGHGATLDGSELLKPADWEMVSPGLYRNRNLLRVDPAVLMRWFFVFDGRMNHMGRTSKGPSKPLKKPEELANGEWTYVLDEPLARKSEGGKPWDARQLKGAFYIKIDPAKTLADCHIEAPIRQNGVSLSGRCEHLVIRNVTSTHVHNDGFNIHGYTRDILLENVKAIDCGDDGVSAHDDCQIRVNGLVSMGNSTGACDVGNSVTHYDRVFIKGCLGYDFFMLGSNSHSLSNSVIESSAARCVVIEADRASSNAVCTVTMDNVWVHRVTGTNEFRFGKGAAFEGRRLTLAGLNLLATGGAVTLRDSIIAGTPQPEISIWKDVRWQADHNLYDARFIRLDQTFHSPKTFADYQRTSGQDKTSRWAKVEFKQPFDGQVSKPVPGKGVGVDISQLPSGTH